jgi:hypothetical protein
MPLNLKTKKPIISDWLFLVAGTGLSFTSLRMDLGGRALQGKPSRCATSFFIDFPFIQAFGLLQFKPIKKPESKDSGFP